MYDFSKKELAKRLYDAEYAVKGLPGGGVMVSIPDPDDGSPYLTLFADYSHVAVRKEEDGKFVGKKIKNLDRLDMWNEGKIWSTIEEALHNHKNSLKYFFPEGFTFPVKYGSPTLGDFSMFSIEAIQDLTAKEKAEIENRVRKNDNSGFADQTNNPDYIKKIQDFLDAEERMRIFIVPGSQEYDPIAEENLGTRYVTCPNCHRTSRELVAIPHGYSLPEKAVCPVCGHEAYTEYYNHNPRYFTDFRTVNGILYVERYELKMKYPDIVKNGEVPRGKVESIRFDTGLHIGGGEILMKRSGMSYTRCALSYPYRFVTMCEPTISGDEVYGEVPCSEYIQTDMLDRLEKDYVNLSALRKALEKYGITSDDCPNDQYHGYSEEEKEQIIQAMSDYPTDYGSFAQRDQF